jgi:uncharacterized protein (TIGR02145 family)
MKLVCLGDFLFVVLKTRVICNINLKIQFMKNISKKISVLFLFITLSLLGFSQSIKEIKVGNQIWMAENLNVVNFSNGNPIPQAQSDEEWVKACEEGRPAWCYFYSEYNNHENAEEEYGILYNWYAVIDPRGLAPKGWHTPTLEEWVQLERHRQLEYSTGARISSIGLRNQKGGGRSKKGTFFYCYRWWTKTECKYKDCSGQAYSRELSETASDTHYNSMDKCFGFQVRCVKN